MGRCPDIARAQVARLREQGIEPDLDELAEILYWGQRVERPRGQTSPCVEPLPIYAGSRTFWPLTLQAEEWLAAAGEWLRGRPAMHAVLFASEHAREPGVFTGLYIRRAAIVRLTEWRRGCDLTEAELANVAASLTADEAVTEAPARVPSDVDLGRVLAELFATTGQPPDYWLTRTSRHMLDVLAAITRREAMAVGRPQLAPDESREALRELALTCDRIAKARCRKSP